MTTQKDPFARVFKSKRVETTAYKNIYQDTLNFTFTPSRSTFKWETIDRYSKDGVREILLNSLDLFNFYDHYRGLHSSDNVVDGEDAGEF